MDDNWSIEFYAKSHKNYIQLHSLKLKIQTKQIICKHLLFIKQCLKWHTVQDENIQLDEITYFDAFPENLPIFLKLGNKYNILIENQCYEIIY